MSAADDLKYAVRAASDCMNELSEENHRLMDLLNVVANMGIDPDDPGSEEWTFLEDAAKFVKDNT